MKKILIVEDDQIVANIYRNKFCVEGFQVEVALDGSSGLDLVRQFRPDAVILDLMLPKLTGVELMKQIRSEPDFKLLPLIVLSNTYLTGMVQEAWKVGATKCLFKAHCTPKQVIDLVRKELGGENRSKPSHDPAAGLALKPKPELTVARAKHENEDAEFQDELKKAFIDSSAATLGALRSLLQATIKAENDAARLKQMQELYSCVHTLAGNAGIAGMRQIGQMAEALEALLKELHEKPNNITASTLRTVASAIDFLGVLFKRGLLPGQQQSLEGNILVVDDEAISRRAVTYALEKARLKSVNVEDPVTAYNLLSKDRFDLVFLDVDMPGMTGFELCSKLRTLPQHKQTPVIFVTSLNDFESRASSMMSGGTDFIAKPFLFIELAVKALVYILRNRLAVPRADGRDAKATAVS